MAYAYDVSVTSHEAAYVRLGHVTYPSTSRAVYYNYAASGVGVPLNRLDNIADNAQGTTTYAQYTYLGAGTVVSVAHPQFTNGLNLTYGSAGTYGGFDRFGRVIDQKWQNDAATTTFDRYTYGYDANSNRLYRKNEVARAASVKFDEEYSYDNLDRLKESHRGLLTASTRSRRRTDRPASDDGPDPRGSLALEALGNWGRYQVDSTGTETYTGPTNLDQDRSHNAANEIDGNDGNPIRPHENSNTPDWVDPVHDAAGNMTQGPKPGAETSALHFVYDAWNRLARWRSGADNSRAGTARCEVPVRRPDRRVAKLRYVERD